MKKIIIFSASVFAIYLLWKLTIQIFHYPTYILPSPQLVYSSLLDLILSGKIWPHIDRTLKEIFLGMIIGCFCGIIFGYFLAKKEWLKITFAPYVVALQTIPAVALAPIFVLWFGSGIASKVAVCALIVFLPIMINTSAAITTINENYKDLFHSYNASSWHILTKLEMPSSLPYLFSSLKICLVLSIVGAVVGEFLGADKGLGFLVNSYLGLIDTPRLFAVLIIMAGLGIFFYFSSSILESIFLTYAPKKDITYQ